MSRNPGVARRGLPPAAAGLPVPADKRFRRSDVRQGRRRNWRRLLFRAVWFGGSTLVLVALVAWLGSVLVAAPVLQVNRLVVSGNVRVSTAEVESRLQGIRGESLLKVDLERYRLRLLESPWVASAELWRVLPSTVQLRITERRPLAVARLHGQLYLVDAQAVIIDSFGPQYAQFDLPIVDGLITDASNGVVVDPARLLLVQRLFRELSAKADLFRRVSQVDVSDSRNAIVLLEGEPAQLQLGDTQFVERLQCWQDMASNVRAQLAVNEYVNLRLGCTRLSVK